MSDNLVIEHLRHIRFQVDGLRADMSEVKERLGLLEAQSASMSRRIDRVGGDVEEIRRRLDIVSA